MEPADREKHQYAAIATKTSNIKNELTIELSHLDHDADDFDP